MTGVLAVVGSGPIAAAVREAGLEAGEGVVTPKGHDPAAGLIEALAGRALSSLYIGSAPARAPATVTECDVEAFDAAWVEGVERVWACLAAALPELARARGSVVIELGLGYGAGRSRDVAGATVSAALVGLVRVAALEYARDGIRVNGLLWAGGEHAAEAPAGATVSAAAAARVARSLLGPATGAVNGAIVPADGGISATAMIPGEVPDAPL